MTVCVCAEREYCADVPGDPESCPHCVRPPTDHPGSPVLSRCGLPHSPADPARVVEYGLKYTEANGKVSYGVFANRAGAERTAAAITGRGWSTVRVEVEERDVSPWRPAKSVEEVPPKPLDVSDTTG